MEIFQVFVAIFSKSSAADLLYVGTLYTDMEWVYIVIL